MADKEGIQLVRVTTTIVASVIVIGLGFKLMKFLGIIPTLVNDRLLKNKSLTGAFFLSNENDKTIDGGEAIDIVYDLHDAKGTFNDDESKIYGLLSKAGTKVNLSYVSYLFANQYDVSLASYLDSFLSEAEQKKVVKVINALPNK